MATIYDVARAAGVSAATVSRSFGTKYQVSSETRERVIREAAKLNYRAHIASLRESGKSVRPIGFVYFAGMTSDKLPANSFYGPVLAGAQAEADRLSAYLVLNTTDRLAGACSLPRMISERAVSGALLVGAAPPESVRAFSKLVPNIVLVDNRDSAMQYDCVVSDGFRGSACAVEHMRNLGHRQIAFVTSRQLDASFKDRLNGYICALHHSGIDVDPGMVCVVDEPEMTSSIDATVAQIVAFLESFRERDRPTAVVAVNDAHALAVLYACRRIGIPVPHQMSIIGFDDTEFSAHTFPALTTMRVDKENMGRIAVRQLWKRLCASVGEGQVEPPISIELAVTLIERGSCAAPVTGFTDSTGGRPRRHGVERAPLLSAGKPSRQVAVGA